MDRPSFAYQVHFQASYHVLNRENFWKANATENHACCSVGNSNHSQFLLLLVRFSQHFPQKEQDCFPEKKKDLPNRSTMSSEFFLGFPYCELAEHLAELLLKKN